MVSCPGNGPTPSPVSYAIFSLVIILAVNPLLGWMAADESILSASASYIRIETVANIFGMLSSLALVALVTLNKEKYLYILTATRLVFSLLSDTLIDAVVDGLGNPVYFKLTGVNVHDSTVAVEVRSHLDLSDSTVLADKAYGTNEILGYIQQQDGNYVIPPKSNTRTPWWCDWVLYKERHLVEYFFLKLKQFRRVATHYDKLASSFLAFIYLVAIAILLK